MNIQGIRISDSKDNVLFVKLSDILEEIPYGFSLCWSILFLDGTPNQGEGRFLSEYQNRINKSENGLRIDWKDLKSLSKKYFQMFETTILGCRDANLLHRFDDEKEMYHTCDIVIDLIDCAFWEVYSKDSVIIDNLNRKFKEIEILYRTRP
jgi:hypothetical protein